MTYLIRVDRHFFGPMTDSTLLLEENGVPEEFPSEEAAQARIDELDQEVYYLAHGESSRPDYTIVEAEDVQ